MATDLLAIAVGGATGALLRFSVSHAIYRKLGRGFPSGTLAVNVAGSFFLGLLAEPLLHLETLAFPWHTLVTTGFLGTFTTFSTFALETAYLLEQGRLSRALGNVVASVGLGLIAAWVGVHSGSWLFVEGPWAEPGWFLWMVLDLLANGVGAFTLGLIVEGICLRFRASSGSRMILAMLAIGSFATLSSLHLVYDFISHNDGFEPIALIVTLAFLANLVVCLLAVWAGLSLVREL